MPRLVRYSNGVGPRGASAGTQVNANSVIARSGLKLGRAFVYTHMDMQCRGDYADRTVYQS
ncbi:hypothetical protein ANRL3_00414 [Anaerolineae bacterium]|nr:hypothetical protein ANRL3_00414 [Anaerolineae bacterium]